MAPLANPRLNGLPGEGKNASAGPLAPWPRSSASVCTAHSALRAADEDIEAPGRRPQTVPTRSEQARSADALLWACGELLEAGEGTRAVALMGAELLLHSAWPSRRLWLNV
mmetsp:Transcript_3099/g.7210  ORF Transcript_3099/g.7210 Transcript_3099/m.7210 type:complete len:111 (+) Transcript_3099:175-507(+)